MLLIRLERRAHTKDEPEHKKRGERERERDLRRRTTQKRIEQIVQMKQVEKKKNCADLGNLPWQPSAISKLHYSLFCFFLSLLSFTLFTVFYLFFNASSANQ